MPSATSKRVSKAGDKQKSSPGKQVEKSQSPKATTARALASKGAVKPRTRGSQATPPVHATIGEQPFFGPDIGRRIRNLRHIKGLTLKDLADRTLCSESMLSKVENGKAQVSLTLLHRIVHSLDITITALFSESRADQGVVTRAKDRSTFRIDANGSRLERLIPPTWDICWKATCTSLSRVAAVMAS